LKYDSQTTKIREISNPYDDEGDELIEEDVFDGVPSEAPSQPPFEIDKESEIY